MGQLNTQADQEAVTEGLGVSVPVFLLDARDSNTSDPSVGGPPSTPEPSLGAAAGLRAPRGTGQTQEVATDQL